jgi:hypothetical protein
MRFGEIGLMKYISEEVCQAVNEQLLIASDSL